MQRNELLDPDPEQVGEGAGVASQSDVIVLVDDPGEVGHHELPTTFDVLREVGDAGIGGQVLDRGYDQPILRQVVGALAKVCRDPRAIERVVPRPGLADVGHGDRRVRIEFTRPAGIGVMQDGHLCVGHGGSHDLAN